MIIFITAGSWNTVSALDASVYTKQSVLSSGKWVKIKVTETGIHTITKADISKWGFSDLSKIRIFGYGGAPVSEILDANQIDDLPQVPLLREGNKIFFFAQSQDTWEYNQRGSIKFKQVQHPYSQAGYYFVTDGEFTDITPEKENSVIKEGAQEIDTFTERIFHEKELISPGQTGRLLLGEDFKYSSSQVFKFSLQDYVPESEITVLTSFAAKISGGTGKLAFQYNGTNLPASSSDNIGSSTSSYDHVRTAETYKKFSLQDKNLNFSVSFSYSGTVFTARLDYITVNYTRNINLDKNQLLFNSENNSANTVYGISGYTDTSHLWDVSKSNKPVEIAPDRNGTKARFAPLANSYREYVAFNTSGSFPAPVFVESVKNQNLHGEEIPELVIISPKEFLSEAERVADLHRKVDNMKVFVVNDKDIFNEFSSGTPDLMAYRKLLKMWWDRGLSSGNSESAKLKYLLLFGRCSYDNRLISEQMKANSYPMLLTWQSKDGANDVSSYNTDDILGFLEDKSGNSLSNDKLNIGIGRMPVKSISEAKTVVDKLYQYVTKNDFGAWKNNILMIADDEDQATHMSQSDACLTEMKNNGGKQYIYNFVYTDAFPAVSNGGGRAYPEARKKMFQKLNEGVLWANYVGHANPVSWTHDGLLTITDMNNMYLNHYPLIATYTCEFTRLDANEVSGGEILFLNGKGGAIALLTTTRVTLIPNNGLIGKVMGGEIFRKDADGKYPRLGDIIKNGKNKISGDGNKLRYLLCGDPALKLAYPSYDIKLNTINGVAVDDENTATIKAREEVSITGSVYDETGEKAIGYNGIIAPTLYDSEVSVETYGHGTEGKKYVYYDRSNKLFTGQDSIRNGDFEVKISMPKEINNNYAPAMFSFYSYNKDGEEGNGASENVYVYGYDETAKPDTEGPEIEYLALNSTSFKNGDKVNESPMVLAEFRDESGINISTSGIGHQMTIVIDEKDFISDVSQYYTPSIGEGYGGTVSYPLSDLTAGYHSLRFKVWDTANNSSEKTIEFTVEPGLKPELYDVYTNSSPASVEALFYLKHNRPDALITVTLSIYDIAGQEVWNHTETGKSDFLTSFPITWNLTDNAGRRVNRGIYVYRASISTDGVNEATKSKKIAVTAE